MRRLKYNDSSQELRFEFPDDWLTPASVKVTITDTNGNELVTADPATVYTATTTDGAVSDGDSEFAVDGADAMEAGDRFRLSKSQSTPEVVKVLSQASKVASIEHTFDYDHPDESAVSAMWCVYDLDTATTIADWPVAREVTITWTPNTDDVPYTEHAVVYKLTGADVPGWREHFRAKYPNLYREATGRLDSLFDDALMELSWHVASMGHDLNDLREPDFIRMPIAALMAGYIASGEGVVGDIEVKQAKDDFNKYYDILSRPALWFDGDQDLTKDEGEVKNLQWEASGPNRFGTW